MRFAARAASLLALPLVAACGDGASDRAATDETAAAAQWTIDTTPRLRLTQQDTITFEGVQGITVLPDGGVVVASYVSNTLRYFDANGAYVRSVGREGKGPGEFQTITAFSRYGDSIAVMDLDEVSQHFTLDGQYVRTDTRPTGGGRPLGHFGSRERVLGRFLLDSLKPDTTSQVHDLLVRGGDSTERQLVVFPSRLLTRASDGKLSAQLYTAHNRVAVFDDGFCAGYGGGATIKCYDVTARCSTRSRSPVERRWR
jgi:hypothetical protein